MPNFPFLYEVLERIEKIHETGADEMGNTWDQGTWGDDMVRPAGYAAPLPRYRMLDGYYRQFNSRGSGNADLLKSIRRIEALPACGTAMCFAGWAVYMHDGEVGPHDAVNDRATEILGLSDFQADCLFYGTNTLDEIRATIRGWDHRG